MSVFILDSPFFVLLTVGLLLIFPFRKERPFTLGMFGFFLIIKAGVYFTSISPYYPIVEVRSFFEGIKVFFILLIDPVLFCCFAAIVFPLKLILKRCFIFFIPAIILGIVYAVIFFSYPLADREIISSLRLNSPEFLNYANVDILNIIVRFIANFYSLFFLIVFANILVFNFPKFLRDNFSNSEQIRMGWARNVGVLFLCSATLYTLLTMSGNKIVLILMVIFELIFCFYTFYILHARYAMKANLLQSYFKSFLLSDYKCFLLRLLFPPKLLSNSNEYGSANMDLEQEEDMETRLSNRMVEYIENSKIYLQKDLCLNDIARVLNTNRTYISKVFSYKMNISFYDFINSYRVEEAKRRMIQYPSIGLKPISEECGFSSYTTFIKYFEKKENMGPNAWKMENVNTSQK